MARAAGKKQSKGAGAQSAAAQAPAQTTTPQAPSIPEPFVPVPNALRPFVSTLPKDHVYAVHIDNTPPSLKKRIFVIPILMNIVITGLLCLRVYYAAPVYLDQIITIFGYETAWKVEPSRMGYGDLMSTITNRTALLMFDYALFGLLGSWPWEFLFGSKYSRYTSACHWRTAIRFKETEIIVRTGRKWDRAICRVEDPNNKKKNKTIKDNNNNDEKKPWSREEELTIKFKVEPAMRKSFTDKTGYLLLDKDWDLDFRAMIDAHRLVDTGKLNLKDLDHIVLVYYQKQWLLWRVHEAMELDNTSNAAGDETLRVFKEKLTALGCEDVFYRWIEIIQYETSLPGGFTQGKQGEAMRELRRLLTERKVDYAKFWDEIGGQNGVPGLTGAG